MHHSRSKYPTGWRDVIRTIILLRDNFKCVLCSAVSLSNHVHHGDEDKANNSPVNLFTVCPKCHRIFHKKGFVFQRPSNFQWSTHEELFNSYLIKVTRMKQ